MRARGVHERHQLQVAASISVTTCESLTVALPLRVVAMRRKRVRTDENQQNMSKEVEEHEAGPPLQSLSAGSAGKDTDRAVPDGAVTRVTHPDQLDAAGAPHSAANPDRRLSSRKRKTVSHVAKLDDEIDSSEDDGGDGAGADWPLFR